ncbi:hypothetical protein [Nocardia sp. CDC160]|uniref:hypothetical protein n=1 Tax=Nocardia sp. CDC160 TaxID=3112166 RepID=UPI002DB8752B|nr:hypothetical protein [Nocardia sp. CDC160]MEC3920296.1 hypothetical protein [Nocardia sp. CDC160]
MMIEIFEQEPAPPRPRPRPARPQPGVLGRWHTASGDIVFRQGEYVVAPIPVALMLLQEAAHKIRDPYYQPRSTLIARLHGH